MKGGREPLLNQKGELSEGVQLSLFVRFFIMLWYPVRFFVSRAGYSYSFYSPIVDLHKIHVTCANMTNSLISAVLI